MFEGVSNPGTSLLFLFLSAQWDAINEMDEYFTPIHTYQVRIGLSAPPA